MTLTLINFWILLPSAQATPAWWSRIFSSRPPDPPQPRGSRGDEFCLIAPVAASSPSRALLDRPTLVWQGAINTVTLWQVDEAKSLWEAEITSVHQLQQVQLEAGRSAYRITADVNLQPDQQYEWRIYQPFTREFISIPFQAVSVQEQAQIQQNLLEGETGEAAVIARANYFASQQLWMDFWREVLSIEQPSADLRRVMSNTFSQLCPRLDMQDSLNSRSPRSPTGQPYREFLFTGTAGQSIEISLESNDFDPTLILLNPEGEVLSEVAGDDQPRLETTLPEAGRYVIRVTSATQSTGSYRLRVVSLW